MAGERDRWTWEARRHTTSARQPLCTRFMNQHFEPRIEDRWRKEAGCPEAAGSLGGRGKEPEGKAGVCREPMADRVYAVLLSEGVAPGPSSFECSHKKRKTKTGN